MIWLALYLIGVVGNATAFAKFYGERGDADHSDALVNSFVMSLMWPMAAFLFWGHVYGQRQLAAKSAAKIADRKAREEQEKIEHEVAVELAMREHGVRALPAKEFVKKYATPVVIK